MVYSLTDGIHTNIFGTAMDDVHFLSQDNSSNINALAWDSDTGTVFWADSGQGSIFAASLQVRKCGVYLEVLVDCMLLIL